MESFHFLRPWWLLGFVPLVLILWRLAARRWGAGNLAELCDPALLPYLIVAEPARVKKSARTGLIGLTGSLALLALAGPVWERLPLPVFRSDDALVIALDLSFGMDATDLKPSRLDRARFKITDLLQARRDGQTALVIYAGDAFTVTPLTDDAATIQSQLSALTTALPPVPGQRADLALDLAARLLQQSGVRSGNILLMTAEVELAQTLAAVKRIEGLGYRVSVLGVGTEAGGPVPRGRSGLWKDSEGNIQVPKLDTEGLRAVAKAGGGVYREITSGPNDIERFLASFDRPGGSVTGPEDSQVRIEQWIEAGPWLVLALLPLAALAFRRGGLLVVVVLLMPLSNPAEAFEWRDLWVKRDLAAQQAFEGQRFEEAARQFGDDAWRAAALYRAGKYEDAVQALKRVDTVEGWYNRGNALAQLQRYPEAIEAYGHVLQRDPNHADAKYNKELLEKSMKQKEEKRQKKSESGKDPQDSGQPKAEQSPEGQDANKGDKKEQDDSGQQDSDSQDQSAEDDQPDQKDGKEGAKPPGQQDSANEPARKAGSDQDDADDPGDRQPEKAAGAPQPGASQSEEKLEAMPDSTERSEEQQANEQWLRRIPDDPAGLLKRKFAWQYRQRQQTNEDSEQ